jgi:hypothetical protein
MLKKIKNIDEIPEKFESIEAEAEFYDTHDFSELIKTSKLEPLKFHKKPKRNFFRPHQAIER